MFVEKNPLTTPLSLPPPLPTATGWSKMTRPFFPMRVIIFRVRVTSRVRVNLNYSLLLTLRFFFSFFFFLFLCQNDVRDTRAPSFKLFVGRLWGLILHWSRAPWLELDSLLELDSGSMLTREMVLLLLCKSFPATQRLLVFRLSLEFGLKDCYNVYCNSFSKGTHAPALPWR